MKFAVGNEVIVAKKVRAYEGDYYGERGVVTGSRRQGEQLCYWVRFDNDPCEVQFTADQLAPADLAIDEEADEA
jgi:uncharacterized protein YodC (DUF2158 family)